MIRATIQQQKQNKNNLHTYPLIFIDIYVSDYLFKALNVIPYFYSVYEYLCTILSFWSHLESGFLYIF